MNRIMFVVSRPGNAIENVILLAADREEAKRCAHRVLGGSIDEYVVTPLTHYPERTVILLDAL